MQEIYDGLMQKVKRAQILVAIAVTEIDFLNYSSGHSGDLFSQGAKKIESKLIQQYLE